MEGPEDHRHCKVCGKVAPADAETCSKVCQKERRRRIEARRGYTYLFYALIVVVALVFFVNILHR